MANLYIFICALIFGFFGANTTKELWFEVLDNGYQLDYLMLLLVIFLDTMAILGFFILFFEQTAQ
jgi:hypothetical protein